MEKTESSPPDTSASRSNLHAFVEATGVSGRTQITNEYSAYPVRLVCNTNHVCVIGFGGGLVSGDVINMKISVNNNACLLCWTQGSTRVYKNVDGKYTISNTIATVASGSMFVSLPDPVCCYENSKFKTASIFHLESDSSLVAVNIFSGGRKGRDELWGLTSLQSLTKLHVNGELVYYDNVNLFHGDASLQLSLSDKMGGYEVFGSVLLVGRQTALLRQRIAVLKRRQTWAAHQLLGQSRKRNVRTETKGKETEKEKEPLVGVVELEHDVMVVSLLASSVEDSYFLLSALLTPLYSGYFDQHVNSKHVPDKKFLLEAAPYASRLPPPRRPATPQSKFGRWHDSDIFKLLDEYDTAALATNQ